MFEGLSKKLIIVGNKDTDVYCEFLSMLISSKDDKSLEEESTIIGIEDGSVDSAIWTDEIYRDNRAHTSSKQKIVFIGETDSSKNIIPNLAFFDDNNYGVRVGWLGNKAVITIDYEVLKKDNFKNYNSFYDEYITLLGTYNPDINKTEQIPTELFFSRIKNKFFNSNEPKKNKLKKAGAIGMVAALAPLSFAIAPVGAVAVAATVGHIGLSASIVSSALEIKDTAKRKEVIVDQLYRYGILKFYLGYLKNFIEE